jgi:mRNA deadenylase 3'-5' endonuclease subunit Ccr4
MFQTATLFKNVMKIVNEKTEYFVVTGDFNTQPNSLNFRFVKGEPPHEDYLEKKDKKEKVMKDCFSIWENFDYEEFDNFGFWIPYEDYRYWLRNLTGEDIKELENDGHPEFTNYTENFKGTLDHFFISSTIGVVNLQKVPTLEEVKPFKGFPCDLYPSDHVSISIDIQLLN